MSTNSKSEVLKNEAVASTSTHFVLPIVPQVSGQDALMAESNHLVRNGASASNNSDSDTIVCDVSPDIVSYIKTMSSKTPQKVSKNITGTRKTSKMGVRKDNRLSLLIRNIFNYLRKNPKKSSLLYENSEAVPIRQEESECNESPGTSFINTSAMTYDDKTPQKLSKIEVPNNNRPGKLSEKMRNSAQFIFHTIDQYDKHLRPSGALDRILKDDSLDLLSTWIDVTEPAQRIVCYLYCIDYEKHLRGISDNIETQNIEETEISLSGKGFITLCSEACSNPKIRKMWKLSDHARETINELLILMHLDNIFKMGCSINPVERKNDRPAITFKPPTTTKCYPVDKEMMVDNASIVFEDRHEFCTYLEANALFEKYNATENKCVIALDAHKLYKQFTEESMSRYLTLPLWLRRFTPMSIYVDILENYVTHLKESKQYRRALRVLDSLISQVTFTQHKRAAWYDMKFKIQLSHLKSVNKAACTLREAWATAHTSLDLPKEVKYNLRRRAKQIIYRRGLHAEHYSALETQAKKFTTENSLRNPEYFYQEPIKDKGPKYMWENKIVSPEIYCCNIYKQRKTVTIAEHWQGKVITTIYFLLFWDIIYTKPLGVSGIFMSHYQLYPLDMWCESFYINRKAKIDNFLTVIENSEPAEIIEMMRERWNETVQYDVPDIVRTANCQQHWDNIKTVVCCLGSQALAAICRRLARNYEYTRNGFPDLTVCGRNYIKFREVKTSDRAKPHQIQWLLYLQEHDIDASICYLRATPEDQSPDDDQPSDSEEESMDVDRSMDGG